MWAAPAGNLEVGHLLGHHLPALALLFHHVQTQAIYFARGLFQVWAAPAGHLEVGQLLGHHLQGLASLAWPLLPRLT